MTKNKSSTRFASEAQEKRVASKLGGRVSSNSGAGRFDKSDIYLDDIDLSIECKTCQTEKNSFSIKKEWLEKHKREAFQTRAANNVIAFNFFYSDNQDYYVIDDKLMRFLVDKLREDN